MKKTNKLKPIERDFIAIWKSKNLSIREISRRLARSSSTVSRELKRNCWRKHYVAIHAQAVSTKRKSASGKRHPLKNKSVYKYVMKKLRCGWSPEQISGRLKLKHPDNKYWHLHWETIYRYIYDQKNTKKNLWEFLPRKQKRRKKKYGRKSQRVRIPDRVSIHKRPKIIENRQEFGHWEGDSIEGKGHKNGIHTQVERQSRYLQAQIVDNLGAKEAVKAQRKIFKKLPSKARKTTTVDNGKEFTNHKKFELPVYFADPYSSWQRGSNEYHNGLIRRYLPKKTDFNQVAQEELNDIISEINNRPKKCLGFRTPLEVFQKKLGVAIGSRM